MSNLVTLAYVSDDGQDLDLRQACKQAAIFDAYACCVHSLLPDVEKDLKSLRPEYDYFIINIASKGRAFILGAALAYSFNEVTVLIIDDVVDMTEQSNLRTVPTLLDAAKYIKHGFA